VSLSRGRCGQPIETGKCYIRSSVPHHPVLWVSRVAADPKDYRDEALRLAKEANLTQRPDLKAALLERAKIALMRAVQLKQRLLFSLQAVDRAADLRLELDKTNRHIQDGERLVEGWGDLMRTRKAEGHDITTHREMLATFWDTLETHTHTVICCLRWSTQTRRSSRRCSCCAMRQAQLRDWGPDDWDVIDADGRDIGRIFKPGAGVPPDHP
jgi:hypothetical protein